MEAYETNTTASTHPASRRQHMLKFLVEQHGMSVADLGKLVGGPSLASMILKGDRELSKAKILLLAKHFGVAAGRVSVTADFGPGEIRFFSTDCLPEQHAFALSVS